MTPLERYFKTLLFDSPDKIPFKPGRPRRSTLARWHSEGLPENAGFFAELLRILGIEGSKDPPVSYLEVTTKMMPEFEEKVLSHENGHYIVQDWMGAITEISDEFDYTDLRQASDFVTRKWHKFPVETETDWESMKKRYDINTYDRFSETFAKNSRDEQAKGALIVMSVSGPFWQMREWCGFEGLCILMAEQPEFVDEMAKFWNDYIASILDRIFNAGAVLDRIIFNEDMAYKAHAMISPAMTRRFLMPSYKRWTQQLKQGGTLLIGVDSDGYVEDLIPLWIESGFNFNTPIEVAAHNDIVNFRAKFGKKMAFDGGIDKRCIAAGGSAIIDELDRIAPVVKDGGYIPSCDHGVPHDISWKNFIEYSSLLAELTGWK